MTTLSDARYSPSSRNGKVSSAAASVRTATSNYSASASASETVVVSVGNHSPGKVDRIDNGRTPSPIGSDELQQVINPIDFDGEVETNNGIPSMRVLRSIEDYPVLDPAGKTRPFKSLYSGHNVARRVLIIFVRHFFCGVSFLFCFIHFTHFAHTTHTTHSLTHSLTHLLNTHNITPHLSPFSPLPSHLSYTYFLPPFLNHQPPFPPSNQNNRTAKNISAPSQPP